MNTTLTHGFSTCLKPVARGVILLLLSASMALPAYAFDGAGPALPATPAASASSEAGIFPSAPGSVNLRKRTRLDRSLQRQDDALRADSERHFDRVQPKSE